MLVSIITPVLNGHSTIEDAIKSVQRQGYKEIEHIVIDGGSIDGTVDIIRSYGGKIAKFVSAKDNGIYDAMNKGIKLASGEVVGILNSDDIYENDSIVETAVNAMITNHADACYGDLVYVDKVNTDKIVRHWKSCEYREGLFEKGWMPPHPTFFVKRSVYIDHGCFDLSLPIALDFEIMFRFMRIFRIRTCYIPEVFTRMRLGGFSNNNILNIIRQNIEIVKILKKNKVDVSPFLFFSKIADKIGQFRPI